MKALLITFASVAAALAGVVGWRFWSAAARGWGEAIETAPTLAGVRSPSDSPPPAGDTEGAAQVEQSPPDSCRDGPRVASPPAAPRAIRWADDAIAAPRASAGGESQSLEALREAAAALAADGRHEAAADAWERVAALATDSPSDRLACSAAMARVGRWTEALRHARFLADALPDDPRAWHNLATAHQALGHLADARAAWTRVLAIAPHDGEARVRRAEVLLDLGAWSDAAADLEAALADEPDAPDAALNLSLAYWRLGRLDDAIARLRDVLARRPSHVPAMNRLAELLWRRAESSPGGGETDPQEAVALLRRSLEADPSQPMIRALLARVQQAMAEGGTEGRRGPGER